MRLILNHIITINEFYRFNINLIFSKLLVGKSLFGKISNRASEHQFGIKIGMTDYNFEWDHLHEMFNLRHEIVHNMKDSKIDFEKGRRFFYNAFLFISYMDSIVFDELRPKRNK